MSRAPILLFGGSGVIGRQTARYLRDAHLDLPLLIGGRDLAKAQKVASEVGLAEGVALDSSLGDLGLGDRRVSAVAVLVKDDLLAGLRFAQQRGVPHLSISSGVQELGPEVAAFMYAPSRAPVVLGTEWLVGATSVPALRLIEAFGRVHDIRLHALIDEQDTIGPAADYDLERLGKTLPAALTRRDGAWTWRVGEKVNFRAVDGVSIQATSFATNDVLALATATGAPNVQFNLATAVSSSRRRGAPMSTEILIELAGEDPQGRPLRTRHAVIHPRGQTPLTAIGVALLLERLLGLDGRPVPAPALYFPAQLLEPVAYYEALTRIGGEVRALEPL